MKGSLELECPSSLYTGGIALVMVALPIESPRLSRDEHEPVMTEVLRPANSSASLRGIPPRPSGRGLGPVRNMAVTCAVRAAMRDIHAPGFNMNRFWRTRFAGLCWRRASRPSGAQWTQRMRSQWV